jgi:hypothetical protein
VASGHNVWGLLNAPATGEALAELIADGVAVSTDLTPFDPVRLRPLTLRQPVIRSGNYDSCRALFALAFAEGARSQRVEQLVTSVAGLFPIRF